MSMVKKKWLRKLFLPVLMCIIGIAAIIIGIIYFNFISQQIYKDSTNYLGEIYGQVNRSFGAFIERNWGLLKGWGNHLSTSEEVKNSVPEFISKEQEYWGFSDFYFISEDETCMTPDGTEVNIASKGSWIVSLSKGNLLWREKRYLQVRK